VAADKKKQVIVIKKITINAAGAHGGSWKVAFADFMTAMMAFFLVMWLVNQSSEEVKKSVADYFSTPSIIEYNFSNFGVELTLEKLFLDLVNEPLKAFEQFVMPVDKKPNVMDLGMKKIQIQFLTDKLEAYAENLQVNSDEITFDIPDEYLFKPNSSDLKKDFPLIMERVRGIVEGLKDNDVFINSELPYKEDGKKKSTRNIAEERLDFVMNKVEQAITNETVDMFGKATVEKVSRFETKRDTRGYIKFRIKQKDARKPKATEGKSKSVEARTNPIEKARSVASEDAPNEKGSGPADQSKSSADGNEVYDNFVDKLTRKVEGHDQ
jgi:chemotaxis protein MotB